jgi:heptosyltransferase-2
MKKSKLVLTNDTGMMHIASAFKIPIVSFWGCTKPSLGFYPYQANIKSEHIITNISEKPCSKHGNSCRFHSSGCIKRIDDDIIFNTVARLLK